MFTRLAPICALLGFLVVGCSRSSSSSAQQPTRLQPLVNSGAAAIEMNGVWQVVEFEPMVSPTSIGPESRFPFGEPEIGSTIEIQEGAFVLAGGFALTDQVGPNSELYSYLNQVDERFALFDRGVRPEPNAQLFNPKTSRLQIVLGSVHDNELVGLIDYDFRYPNGGVATGRYQIRLERR